MEYTIIAVPDMNDSVSRIVLNGIVYQIRFTYNDTESRWYFSLSDAQGAPIVRMVKIVPGFPLNLFMGHDNMPSGVFGCMSNQDVVGREDFNNGTAKFVFIPAE